MDKIIIKDLEIYCHHGLLKEENVLGQKFLLSLELYTNTKKAGMTDDLKYSIDYARLSHFIEEKMKEKNYKLIEAVAEKLSQDILLSFEHVKKIKLEIKKPWAPILLPLDTVGIQIERGWEIVYLSIGSNMGNPKENISNAISSLKKDKKIRIKKISDLIETKPYGGIEQDNFLNGAIEIETIYDPRELLEKIHEIEKEGHRERKVHWGPRTIDIDIVFYADKLVYEKDLCIPHIDMQNREFVLKPLAQIAPFAMNPVYKKSVKELLEDLEKKGEKNG